MKNAFGIMLVMLLALGCSLVFVPELKVSAANGVGKALDFNGSTDYVDCGDTPELEGMSELSIEAWIKGDSFKQYGGIVSKWVYNNQQHYLFGYFMGGNATRLGKFSFFVSQQLTVGLSDSIQSLTNLHLNSWYHIVGVFKGGDYLKLYINGAEDNSKSTTIANIASGTQNVWIGRYGPYYFDGTIDEVRIYNKTLTSAEVLAHYNAGVGQYGRPETGLAGGWHFDEGSGTAASDYSGNGNHGTINGATWVDGHVPLPDIAVTSVSTSSAKVVKGDPVKVYVTAKNLGTPYENFSVTAYYDGNTISTQSLTNLAPGASEDLTFIWDTTGMTYGQYQIKAVASVVQGETNTTNNVKINGDVWIVGYPEASFTSSPTHALENASVLFDASSSQANGGSIIEYEWDFGDGNITSTTSQFITHVYASFGDYVVTLTVTDDEGLTDNVSKSQQVLRRDIAVIDLVPYRSWIYEERWVEINVTLVNEGNFTETATIKLYYNITESKLVGTQTITIDPGKIETLTFNWSTIGVPHAKKYLLTAVATIAFDSDLTDNILNGTTQVHIRILGDINGDDCVDLKDYAIICLSFGSLIGHPDWNPATDLNFDNKVDIRDVFLLVLMFGKGSTP
ncbi:MAG: PKD domain-containing protein [Candidatus Bathyarchaeota archaeon]|nr:PKD domain-containing protein [Candidatus Bathyarchaeota archaeon]